MNLYRNLHRQELVSQRAHLKKRIKGIRAREEALQTFDQCNLLAFENALSDVEAQIASRK